MKLSAPIIITPRLLPGLKIDQTFLSITAERGRWRVYIDAPDFEHTDADMRPPAMRCAHSKHPIQEALAALCSFLGACGESYRYKISFPDSEPENLSLYPPHVAEWAYMHADELTMCELELEESEEELVTDEN